MNNRTKYELHLTSECKVICNSHINLQLATRNSQCDSQLARLTYFSYSISSPIRRISFHKSFQKNNGLYFSKGTPQSTPWGYPRFYNYPSARDNPEQVTAAIIKELERGRTARPFIHPAFENFRCPPLDAVPKKEGTHHLIIDLSSPIMDYPSMTLSSRRIIL